MVWFLVVWWSVIPYPYPTLEMCEMAEKIMAGDYDSNLIPIPNPPFYLAYPKSWCIPVPKKD